MLLYVKKAKESLNRVHVTTQECSCIDANYASYDAIENLDKALTKTTFEGSRYFVSKAELLAKTVLTALDACEENNLVPTTDMVEENLHNEEIQLVAQQKQLEEQQKQITERLLKQKAMRAKLASEKAAKNRKQQEIIRETETFLLVYNQLIDKFAETSKCTAPSLTLIKRSNTQLDSETLKATQLYYANSIRQMTDDLITALERCEQ